MRYLNYVANKFDLRKDIQFNSRVTNAAYGEAGNCWEIEIENGARTRGQFLITAIGPLSVPTMPNIEGVDTFRGASFHTGKWPHAPVDFKGKRVAVIGTGATGVQVIQEVAKTAGHLTIFQRTPNWCAPLHNSLIDDVTQCKIKGSYPEIFKKCLESHGCFIHNTDPHNALEVSPQERKAFYEKLYGEPGFGIWMGNFRDVLIDQEADDTVSAFIRKKIRTRVKDPKVAEKLIPAITASAPSVYPGD